MAPGSHAGGRGKAVKATLDTTDRGLTASVLANGFDPVQGRDCYVLTVADAEGHGAVEVEATDLGLAELAGAVVERLGVEEDWPATGRGLLAVMGRASSRLLAAALTAAIEEEDRETAARRARR